MDYFKKSDNNQSWNINLIKKNKIYFYKNRFIKIIIK